MPKKRIYLQPPIIGNINMNKPPYTHCKNCGAKLEGPYCHNCGQYAMDLHTSFWSFVKHFLSQEYLLNKKFPKTLWTLIRYPGKLTNEFMEGKIKKYSNPLSINKTILVILAFIMVLTRTPWNSPSTYQNAESIPARTMMQFSTSKDSLWMEAERCQKRQITLIAPQSVISEYPELFVISEYKMSETGDSNDTLTVSVPEVMLTSSIITRSSYGSRELYSFSPKNQYYERYSDIERLIKDDTKTVYRHFMPLLILLSTPLLAFLIQLFFRKSKKKYITHYIFTLHYCIVYEIILLLKGLLQYIFNSDSSYIFDVSFILSVVYLAIASKRVYDGQSWIKCSIKSFLINAIYQGTIYLTIMIVIGVILISHIIKL